MLDEVLKELKANQGTVPQPYGAEVAQAYRDGKLDPDTCLHVIAVLLGKLAEG
jgi:hypothetical protein